MNVLGINILFDKKSKLREKLYTYNEEAGYVCFPNANVIVETIDSHNYKKVLNSSIFNVCDGTAPMLYTKLIYKKDVEKYPGPNFMIDVFEDGYMGKSHYLLGATEDVLNKLKENLSYFKCNIDGMYSPPFKEVEKFDYLAIANMINQSGAKIVWVSLGAPKQEKFMYNLVPYLNDSIVCLGVGAAFDFHASTLKRAPIFFQRYGIEWLYRIFKEPRRLFLRYMYVNTKFVLLGIIQYIKVRKK